MLETVENHAKSVQGAAMAVAIGYALKAPALVLFSLVAVGIASCGLGGEGGPMAVLIITVISEELGKLVSKETKLDIIVTPFVTIFSVVILSMLCAPYIGMAASSVGNAIMCVIKQVFLMEFYVIILMKQMPK